MISGRRRLLAGAALATLAIAAAPERAAAQAIEPKAQAIVEAMGAYLASLQAFAVTTDVSLEGVTAEGEKIELLGVGSTIVARPNLLYGDSLGSMLEQKYYYDGKTLTLFQPGADTYATVKAPATIDATLDFAAGTLGVEAPAADLIATDGAKRLLAASTSGRYVGETTINGVRCQQVAFRGTDVDWQLWVQTGPKPLPCRYSINSKNVAGSPSFAITLRDWNLRPSVNASTFTFRPPVGARQVPFKLDDGSLAGK